jgi:hypothetical protein
MLDTTRYAPWAVLTVGALVVMGSQLLGPPRGTHLALTFGGGALMFGGIVWAELRSEHGCLVDERHAEIHHRSGYFAFTVLGALLVVGTLMLTNTGVSAPAEPLLFGAALFGLVAYRGSVEWHKRTM